MLMPKSRLFCLRFSVWPFLFTFNGKSIFLIFKKYVCRYSDRESLCLRFSFLRIAHEIISFHKLNRQTAVFSVFLFASIYSTVLRFSSLYNVDRDIPTARAICAFGTPCRSNISICARFSLVRCWNFLCPCDMLFLSHSLPPWFLVCSYFIIPLLL